MTQVPFGQPPLHAGGQGVDGFPVGRGEGGFRLGKQPAMSGGWLGPVGVVPVLSGELVTPASFGELSLPTSAKRESGK